MEEEILKKINEQEEKLDNIFKSVEKMRKYFLWTLIISIAFFVIPLIGLMVVIPKFLTTFQAGYLGL